MNNSAEFYSLRIAEAQAEADAATLDNARERALRSIASWITLGDQAKKIAERRARLQLERELAEAAALLDTAD